MKAHLLDSKGRPIKVDDDEEDRCPRCMGTHMEKFMLFGGTSQMICQDCGATVVPKEG
jgi:hypothetical protein